jgi:hypothetical protein
MCDKDGIKGHRFGKLADPYSLPTEERIIFRKYQNPIIQ